MPNLKIIWDVLHSIEYKEDIYDTIAYLLNNYKGTLLIDADGLNIVSKNLEWLEDILRTTREENSAKMIVIGTHKPVHSENASYMIQDRDENVMALCDKYAVDLVLTGHYHSELITPDYYGGTYSTNPLLGTNYLIGNSSRLEGKDANGYVIDVINEYNKLTSLPIITLLPLNSL